MPTSVRSRRPATAKKLSVCARQAAINASNTASRTTTPTPRLAVEHISASIDARPFLNQVREALDGNILHYSERLRLIRTADRMGIARFEANLLIATVQHRAQQQSRPAPAGTVSPTPDSRAARIVMLTAALLTAEFFLLRVLMHALTGS